VTVAERVISGELAAGLSEYRAQWVAIKNSKVVAASVDASALLKELRDQNVSGAALHRVPEDPQAVYIL
jgi:Family of unknown function (DUF5678)